MGGVDLNDRFTAYYRTKIRTKKWTVRVYAHFLDPAVCNGWVEYQEHRAQHGMPRKEVLDLLDFKLQIAESLILSAKMLSPHQAYGNEKQQPRKRGRQDDASDAESSEEEVVRSTTPKRQ